MRRDNCIEATDKAMYREGGLLLPSDKVHVNTVFNPGLAWYMQSHIQYDIRKRNILKKRRKKKGGG